MILPNPGGKVGHRRTHTEMPPTYVGGVSICRLGIQNNGENDRQRIENCRLIDAARILDAGFDTKGDSGRQQAGR